ncbi:MAG: polyphosphate polymerase domain-containing protein [Ruminococcus sp.]|jgi:hypothetical protein|nr:polyphosphate polymerase domain-containing protein [Ruminococcus sp.]
MSLTTETQIQEIFKRYEKKYLLTCRQMEMLLGEIGDRAQADIYGKYSIYNIYFDTPDYRLIRTSIEKPIYKEKIRLRSYCIPAADETVYLELKKKSEGVVGKRRVLLTRREAEEYLLRGVYPWKTDCQVLHEIDFALSRYQVTPAAYISYERQALSGGEDSRLRITFDSHIVCRSTDLQLQKGKYGISLLDKEQVLMEIKIPGAMPVWLSRLLSEMEIFPVSYSKYGMYYKRFLLREAYKPRYESIQGVTNLKGGVCYA